MSLKFIVSVVANENETIASIIIDIGESVIEKIGNGIAVHAFVLLLRKLNDYKLLLLASLGGFEPYTFSAGPRLRRPML